jgi:glutaminyl-peptide cyclotransferase
MRSRLLLILIGVATLGGGAALWLRERAAPRLGEAAYRQTAAILAFGPRPAGSEALDKVRAHVRRELEAAGWVTTLMEFQGPTPVGSVRFANVRARHPGAGGDPWDRQVDALLCAHIDSKFYTDRRFLGADDAASACAAIIEIARVLALEQPRQAERIELVFFDGEESFGPNIVPQDGLYGSRHYAKQWQGRADKPAFGILLDMIGHQDLAIRLPSDSPPRLRDALLAAAKQENAAANFGMAKGPIIDDHVPLNNVGIPTLDVIGDFTRSDWWHTASDNLDLISPVSLDISMRVTLRTLNSLLAD